jgi:hypothetical protein
MGRRSVKSHPGGPSTIHVAHTASSRSMKSLSAALALIFPWNESQPRGAIGSSCVDPTAWLGAGCDASRSTLPFRREVCFDGMASRHSAIAYVTDERVWWSARWILPRWRGASASTTS